MEPRTVSIWGKGRTFPILALVVAVLAAALLTLTLVGADPAEAKKNKARGGKIVFASDRTTKSNPEGDREIFTIKPDGKGLKQLTFNTASDHNPAWSPDGKQIAFSTNRDGNNEVYRMNADGSDQTNLSNSTATDFDPAYSPDGKQIAFSTIRGGNDEVYKMNADGSKQANLTNNMASDLLISAQTSKSRSPVA